MVSRLPNGLRVASEPKFGKFCTVGVAIDSGSRYEVAFPSGVSHFIDKLAFGPTPRYPQGRDGIQEQLEKYGGICDCQGSRDTMIYGISVETSGLAMAVDILADVVLRPIVNDEQMEMIRTTISYELEDLNLNPNPEGLLQEFIHAAAFRDNTIGLPRLCPPENLNLITGDMLYRYLARLYDPKRIVLAGVGVDHQQLLEAAKVSLRNPDGEGISFDDIPFAMFCLLCELAHVFLPHSLKGTMERRPSYLGTKSRVARKQTTEANRHFRRPIHR